MPLTTLFLTDEAVETLRTMAREYPTGRLTLNRFINRATLGWAMHSRPVFAAPTFESHTALIRTLTQGGANYGVKDGGQLAYDFRRKRVLNVAPHAITYLAALAEFFEIPTKTAFASSYTPSANALASLTLEYIARDWIYFEQRPDSSVPPGANPRGTGRDE